MSTITFDTQLFVSRLRAAGFDEAQAEAVIRALVDAQDKLVTREHFDARLTQLETRIDGDTKLTRWMLSLLLGGVFSLVMKTFF